MKSMVSTDRMIRTSQHNEATKVNEGRNDKKNYDGFPKIS